MLPLLSPPPPSDATLPMLDFIFENPLDGCFKDNASIRLLLRTHADHVVSRATSYCHYGFAYRKRTVLVTSLCEFAPTAPCPTPPCAHYSQNGHHAEQLVEHSKEKRNSLPPRLVDELLSAWIAKHTNRARELLVVDLFAGWGSVKKRAAQAWPRVKVYANDLVDRDGIDLTVDLADDTEARIRLVLTFALLRHWPDAKPTAGVFEWLEEHRVAVLFVCSTPCRTYSIEGAGVHRRPDGAPKTRAAADDDNMNAALVRAFAQFCFDACHVARTN
jgi:hypothetical protein